MGFTFKEELAAVGATLKIPHFTKGKHQLSGKEVDTLHQLANVRFHVELLAKLKKLACYLYP